jgi:hypothetical protein
MGVLAWAWRGRTSRAACTSATEPACLVRSVATEDVDRALVTLVPHTTALRGTRFEVTVSVRYLKAGGFDAQRMTARLGARA